MSTLQGTRPATAASSAYTPIEDYAIVGDCRSAALVSRDGSIDWLCWPRFDSEPVFSRLLDAGKGGYFAITPADVREVTRSYVPDTNVLTTRFRCATGVLQLTDFFFAASENEKRRWFLPRSLLVRRLECLEGTVQVDVTISPTLGFDLRRPGIKPRDRGSCTLQVRDGIVHLAGDVDLQITDGSATSRVALEAGETRQLVLSFNENGPAVFPPLAAVPQLHEATLDYWRRWSAQIRYDGPQRDAVVRSSLVLKLLTFSPSGAIVAAPTTSLPERIGGPYNWDYRFCWLRDASFVIRAFFELGLEAEAMAFSQWLLHSTRLTQPRLQVLYTVFGRSLPKEQCPPGLEGYAGSLPVRVRNDAHRQHQLDIYGEVLDAAVARRAAGRSLNRDERSFLEGLTKYVLQHWREPDAGIWETRRDPHHSVHSKVMCWLALTRAAELVRDGELKLDLETLEAKAAAIAAVVESRGFSAELGGYAGALDSSDPDAAVLALPLVGFEPGASERMQSTIEMLQRRLGRGDLIYRHTSSETGDEGCFVACSFWLVQALAAAGRRAEAEAMFDRLCQRGNDAGLFAEEIDPDSGAFLGNFPQAFSHVALINAALSMRDGASERTNRQ